MTALGILDSLDRAAELVTVADHEDPDRDDAELYGRLLPIFDAAYGALGGTFESLAAIRASSSSASPVSAAEGLRPAASGDVPPTE